MSRLQRLDELGLALPAPMPSVGDYLPARQHDGLLWVSGHTGRGPDGLRVRGVVGDDVDVDTARAEARRAALNVIATVHAAVGIDTVRAVVHLRGYVRAAGGFTQHPQVVDAASELLAAVFGDVGRHARAAVGAGSLPGGACVELEAVFAVDR
ncbi:RidA family protein [Streptomyces sp. 110]|uniref:RidA family protein n=1 Tax=Streptomyces endocoffeicus TaxID=2898945 RepID=A0ABS1PVI3_9ACTN|nr:RidA family protein [Streptomyces endocoffeicus]MBL1116447.1 RidA family protein [Streptomyces endocoffeicus]